MLTFKLRYYFISTVSLLFILLFVYAGASKLIDYENFRVQLGQSPILSYYADWIAWAVPAFEIVIALMLSFPRTKLPALFASYILMLLFTAYIFIILNFSESIPCSCGGILEKMGWDEHLIFNIGFVIMAFAAIVCYPVNPKIKLS